MLRATPFRSLKAVAITVTTSLLLAAVVVPHRHLVLTKASVEDDGILTSSSDDPCLACQLSKGLSPPPTVLRVGQMAPAVVAFHPCSRSDVPRPAFTVRARSPRAPPVAAS